jgi:hypothetical protein
VSEAAVSSIGRIWATSIKPVGEVAKAARQAKELAKIDRQEELKAARSDQTARKVLDVLHTCGPMTKAKIRERTRASGATVNEAVEILLERGEIESCEAGSYPGFRAVQEKPGQGWTKQGCPGVEGVDGQAAPIGGRVVQSIQDQGHGLHGQSCPGSEGQF